MSEQTSTRRFALIIANDAYDDRRLSSLQTPARDADGLARVLRDPAIGGFVGVEFVVNQKAETVRDAIVHFFQGKERDDLLLVYFSGHGVRDEDDGSLYLVVKDTDVDAPSSRGIEARFITREMDKSRVRRIVLIFDCCYSGAFERGRKSTSVGTPVDVGAPFEGSGGQGRVVLTASSAVQVAWVGDEVLTDETEHSLYTHYLIEGLETGAAGGTSEWITVNALHNYANRQVTQSSEASGEKVQTPQMWVYGQTAEIIIARNPRPAVLHRPTTTPALGHHFISYSPLDGEDTALKLYDALVGDPSPLPVWVDQRDVQQPGPAWDAQVEQALKDCATLLLVVTPGSAAAGCDCEREWRYALRYKKPIVPLLFDPAAHPPLYLENRRAVDLGGDLGPALTQLRRHVAWLETPEGTLQALKDRLADAQRDLRPAEAAQKARIRQEMALLQKQIAAQQQVVDDPQQAAQRTEQNIQSGLERERKPARPVTGATRTRFINLPPFTAPDYFQDRTVELGLLGEFLKSDACRMVTVVGRAGIGKTAMTCLLLKSLENGRLPSLGGPSPAHTDGEPLAVDGIVYLSAVGSRRVNVPNLYADLCKLLPDETAARLDALYKDPHASTTAKMEALLAAFPGGRVIVLLDNFEDVVDPATHALRDDETGRELDEAIRALLDAPHHGVKLVLTTRVAPRDLLLVQPGRQNSIQLDEGLESPYAENILRAMDGDGTVGLRDAPDELLDRARTRTRGYPRALEALYGILSADRHTTLPELLDTAEHLLPENVVAALVGQAFERLDPAARQVMQALAVYDRPVTPAAVDYLLQPYQPGADSAPLLNRLVAMHFARKEGGRYHLHPVDRAYAFERVPLGEEADRDKAGVEREFSIEEILRGRSRPKSDYTGPPVWSQFALLHRGAEYFRQARKPRAEWKTLDDLAPQLAEFDLRCAGQEYDTAVYVLLEIDYDYLLLWGHYRLMVELHERLQGKLGDPTLERRSVGNLGMAYWNMGQVQKAITCHEQALASACEMNNRQAEGVWLGNLGIAYHILGKMKGDEEHPGAIEYYEQALQIARETGDRRGEGTWLGNLGAAYRVLGEMERAIEYYEQALQIARETGDRRGEGNHLGNLGIAYRHMGEMGRAIEYYEQALQIDRETGDRSGEGNRLGNLAEVLTDEGRYAEAIQHAQEAVAIAEEISTPASFENATLALALLYAGDLTAARAAAQAARQYDVPENNHYALALLGVIALLQGEQEGAREAFAAAIVQADGLLALTARNYAALDSKGLALCGLALCESRNQGFGKTLVSDAIAAYRAARAITNAPGIVGRVLRLLDALAVVDDEGLLDAVREAAGGEERAHQP